MRGWSIACYCMCYVIGVIVLCNFVAEEMSGKVDTHKKAQRGRRKLAEIYSTA